MGAVSQALVEFANHHRQEEGPGIEVTIGPRCQITVQPDFPRPGPNSVTFIRCPADEVDSLVDEVRAAVAPRHVPLMWILDPETEPRDLGARLEKRGIVPDPHGADVAVMVLPIEADIRTPDVAGLEFQDALAHSATYRSAQQVAVEAFEGTSIKGDAAELAALERRRVNALAAGNRRQPLAVIDGEPAGTGGLTLHAPVAAIINGGAVRPKFRGRGIYQALVAERLKIARAEGAGGLTVWGGTMSRPILERLGFQTVGWRRFYLDTSTL